MRAVIQVRANWLTSYSNVFTPITIAPGRSAGYTPTTTYATDQTWRVQIISVSSNGGVSGQGQIHCK
jgi:hypothetical protein